MIHIHNLVLQKIACYNRSRYKRFQLYLHFSRASCTYQNNMVATVHQALWFVCTSIVFIELSHKGWFRTAPFASISRRQIWVWAAIYRPIWSILRHDMMIEIEDWSQKICKRHLVLAARSADLKWFPWLPSCANVFKVVVVVFREPIQ